MKHPPLPRLLVVLLLAITALAASAYDFEVDGIYYNKNSDGTSVSVTYKDSNYNSYSGSVTIPSQVTHSGTTYSVTEIGRAAFLKCTGLTSVTIPNSVTSISNSAFQSCSGLTSVTIPNSVTKIGSQAFCYCSGLTSVAIPNSVTEIDTFIFYNCSGLTSVTIPNSVTKIGIKAFYGCSGLTSVTIPNSVTSIGSGAFEGCSGLVKNAYPEHLSKPFSNGFSVAYPSDGEVQEDGSIYNATKTALYYVPFDVTDFSIPNTVTSIGNKAFYGCSSLTSVTIPNSVTSIGSYAFSGCSGLTSVTYNAKNCELPQSWLSDCNAITTFGIGSDVQNIPAYLCYGLGNLTTVTIPNSVTSIGNKAFYGCSSLTSVIIPNSVTSIGNEAFNGCFNLVKSAYPEHLSNPFSYGIFIAYPSDGEAQEDGTVYNADKTALYFVPFEVTDFSVPNSVTKIGSSAFDGCSGLTSVTIPNSVTEIKSFAFYDCTGLTNITIPKSVTSIGTKAFAKCSSLKSVVFGAGLTSISSDAFSECSIKKAFWLANTPPSGCNSVAATVRYVANDQYSFSNQTKYQFLSSMFTVDGTVYVPVSPSERTCDVIDCTYSPDDKDITIAETVTNKGVSLIVVTVKPYSHIGNPYIESASISHNGSIGNYAFQNCTALQTATVSNGGSVGEYAFDGCTNLQELTLTNEGDVLQYAFQNTGSIENLTIANKGNLGKYAFTGSKLQNVSIENEGYIGVFAFSGCTALQTATISNQGNIGNYAFQNCTALQSAAVSNVGSVREYAFDGCTKLQELTLTNEGDILQYAFQNTGRIANLTIANKGNLGAYAFKGSKLQNVTVANEGAFGDSAFSGCTALQTATISNQSSVGASAFSGCSSLATATLGEEVTGIGEKAFFNCSALGEIVIPDAVTTVGYSAFEGCAKLKNVSIGKGITSLPERVFYGCSSLPSLLIPSNVASIDVYAFGGCTVLSDFTIEDGEDLLTLGSNATSPLFVDCQLDEVYIGRKLSYSTASDAGYSPFYNNAYLRVVEFNDAENTIYANEFSGCRNLNSIKIGNNISSIGEKAFYNCSALGEIVIPDAVTAVGTSAFEGCAKLENVSIGKGVALLPKRVFYGCSSLPSLTIPNNVASVAYYAFGGCSALSALTIEDAEETGPSEDEPQDERQELFFDDWTSTNHDHLSTSYKEYSFVAAVGDVLTFNYAVSSEANHDYLLILLNGTNIIEVSGTKSGSYRKEFTEAGSVTLNLRYIKDSSGSKGDDLASVTEIRVNDVLQTVDNSGLSLTLASNGSSPLFVDCPLDEVYIGRKLRYSTASDAGYSPFYNNAYLRVVEFNDAENTIYDKEFYGCSNLNSIKIGNNISSIGVSAFNNCSALGEIVIPDAVTTVGASAFRNCAALENVSIGKGVTSLPWRMFYGCSSLPSLTIPNNVAWIDDWAFCRCTALSDLTIEDAEEHESSEDERQELSFDDWTSTNHDNSSTSYQVYSFSADAGDVLTFNYSVSSESNCDFLIIKLNGTEIVKESGEKSGSYRKEFTEPCSVWLDLSYVKDRGANIGSDQATVTDIRVNRATFLSLGANGSLPLFVDCPLDEVYIGRELRYSTDSSAGYSPFYRNTSLRAVEITDAETQIYDNEFYGCTNLQTLKIGNGVKTIGKWAFSGCSSMEYFSAGFEVESIGQEAFSDCTGLTSYYSYSMVPPTCGDQALDDINKWECTLYIPANSTDEYMAADQWKEFFFLSEMDAVLAAEILLNCNEFVLSSGDTFQLTAEVLPANVTDPSVVWSSSNPEVATVDDNGLVTAVYEGTATIIATSADGNAMATADVEVKINTGIEDVTVDGAADIEVYNAAGMKMGTSLHNLVPGVYFVRQGTKVTKVVVK